MSSLATIRANVRKDLHDEDATAFRWTDAVLQRHIERALREFSFYAPLEKKSTVVTVANPEGLGSGAAPQQPPKEAPRVLVPPAKKVKKPGASN